MNRLEGNDVYIGDLRSPKRDSFRLRATRDDADLTNAALIQSIRAEEELRAQRVIDRYTDHAEARRHTGLLLFFAVGLLLGAGLGYLTATLGVL